jgi:hypothetical protein
MTHVAFELGIRESWCRIAFYPFSWKIFGQQIDAGPSNYALGPIRLTLN